jgi:hypothetical protein
MAVLWHEEWNGKSKKMTALVCEVNLLWRDLNAEGNFQQ